MAFDKYQKGAFFNCQLSTASSTVAFSRDFLNPFDISGYLNLWDIFKFIFRERTENDFFHENMVAEKNISSSNA